MARATSFLDDETDQENYVPVGPEQDDEQVLTPEYTRISSPQDVPAAHVFGTPVSAGPSAQLAAPTPAETATKRAAELAGQRPERPKPGFWRNLASIGAGLGAGYSNATGKDLPQVDVGRVMDNVKFGGYNRKVGDWANRTADAERQAKELGIGEAEQKANAVQASTANLQGAHARLADAQAEALQYDKPVSDYIPVGPRGTLQKSTGRIIGAPGPLAPKEPTNAFEAGLRSQRNALGRELTLDEIADVHKKTSGGALPTNLPNAQIAIRAAGKTTNIPEIDALTPNEAKGVLDRLNPEKPDPFAMIDARADRQDIRTQNTLDTQNRRVDQRQISDLQMKEQQLHNLRGALGRELSKPDTAPANDLKTGKPLIDAKKRAVLIKDVREGLQSQYDQATQSAAELQQQQVAIAAQNRPSMTAPPSAEGHPAAAPITAVPAPSKKVKVYDTATGGWK